jgi:signal transduction histidine kinase
LGYDAAGAAEALAHVRDGAREAMAEMDAMTDQLRAAPLENNGLLEALKRQCEALGLRSGATVTFDRGRLPANEAMPPGSAEALFRVAQEALANVARHARANHVRVSLGTDHGLVILEVHDDGKGFDRNQIQTGSGLRNMRARAAEFNAEVTVESPPGGGTTVRFALPYAVADAADFRRKAFWTGSALILVAVLSIANPRGGSSLAILMIIPLFEFVRDTLAWRRARRLEAGTT